MIKKMYYQKVILLAVLLNTIQQTKALPVKKSCPSSCKCVNQKIECSLSSLADATNAYGNAVIDKLTLNGCDGKTNNMKLKIKALVIGCEDIDTYLSLFTAWESDLRTIENTVNGQTARYERTKDNVTSEMCTNNTCVNEAVLVKTKCICITKSSKSSTKPTTTTTTTTIEFSTKLKLSKFMSKTFPTTGFNDSLNDSNKMNATESSEFGKERFYFVITLGSISLATLLINLCMLTSFCLKNDSSVIDCFGHSLMFFNILLALYGAAMATYLSQYELHWHQRFCQGFTSIKLFGMGASVWTFILITYHHSISTSTQEEKDAVFKSIVYILEGLMLSGVFAVMSWIKLDKWEYLCVIFEPKTTVDWLLTGIELWYYFMALVLVIRYPIHELRKKKKVIDEKHLNRNFPIFLMVLVCFVFWVSGYVITLPWYDRVFSSPKLNAVIRVSTIVIPLILQPIIYAIRNTCCCDRSPCSRKKEPSDHLHHSIILQCDCSDDETCPACLNDSDVRFENTMFLGRRESDENGKQCNRRKARIVHEADEDSIESKRGNFTPSKAVPRSPILRNADRFKDGVNEETSLIEKEEAGTTETTKRTVPDTLALPDDSIPLLDDTDGVLKKPPKAILDKDSAMNSPAEYPSFITMENAIDVDALPKPKRSKLKTTPMTDEGRESRGPTFYPLEEEVTSPVGTQKKNKRNTKSESLLKNSIDNTGNTNRKKFSKPPKRKRKRKNQSSIDTNENKIPNHTNQRNSTVSLEWDHSYSYSDSSGSSSGRGSGSFPEEILPSAAAEATTTTKTTSTILKNGGLQHSPTKSDDKSEKEHHAMEWDDSACQIKPSPELKTNSNQTDSNNTKHVVDPNVEFKNKNNTCKNNKNDENLFKAVAPVISKANGKANPIIDNNKTAQPP